MDVQRPVQALVQLAPRGPPRRRRPSAVRAMARVSGAGRTKHEAVSGRGFYKIVGGGLRVGGVGWDKRLLLLELDRLPVRLVIVLLNVAREKVRVARACAGVR